MVWEGLYQDDFKLRLRRKGWHLIAHAPLYSDPRVIAVRHTVRPRNINGGVEEFFKLFGQKTTRKILRAILMAPQSEEQLEPICTNDTRRQEILNTLEMDNLIRRDGEYWMPGSELDGIHDIGRTLEWYVAAWFRRELEVPARHGVELEEIRNGGDLDVVAFVDTVRVWVECKAVPPAKITKSGLGQFLQRNYYFNPEIALLLIDSENSVQLVVDALNEIYREMYTKLARLTIPSLAENARIDIPQALPQQELPHQRRRFRGLYWAPRDVYVANVQGKIGDALDAVLRLYDSQIRH